MSYFHLPDRQAAKVEVEIKRRYEASKTSAALMFHYYDYHMDHVVSDMQDARIDNRGPGESGWSEQITDW